MDPPGQPLGSLGIVEKQGITGVTAVRIKRN
jgi:hypothetical protein